MVAGLTYATYTTQISTLAVVDPTDTNFNTILPSMIDNAELRICQDLDLINNQASNTTFACMPNGRDVNITSTPNQPIFVTIENVNVITPAGTSNPNLGTRVPLTPATKEVIDNLWPSVTGAGVPDKFAVFGQFTLRFGPWPNLGYTLEILGTSRPASLSATNTSTYISLNLPHLFIAASMVYISGYQRNFGRASDDPKMAISWESYYQTMLRTSYVEEARKKFEGPAWTPKSPAMAASPSRTPQPQAQAA